MPPTLAPGQFYQPTNYGAVNPTGTPPTKKRKTYQGIIPTSPITLTIDSDDGTSEAEDESGDGYSNSKLDLTSKSKGTEVIRFEDTDHMTTMLLEVHTKEAAGAST